jgi:hypothetical protein
VYQLEAKARYDEKQKELLEQVYRQFADLLRCSGREIEVYVRSLPPAKQATFAMIRDQSFKIPNARTHRSVPAPTPAQMASEDLTTVISQFVADGDNSSSKA